MQEIANKFQAELDAVHQRKWNFLFGNDSSFFKREIYFFS
jgi:hypothetical protein